MKKYIRIWEIDFLRGIAILLMVFFHLIYDLNVFFKLPVVYQEGIVYYTGKVAASLFITIAGLSCYLSSNNLKRGLVLIGLGLMITLVTFIAVPGSNIVFGILHFLGVSILAYRFFRNLTAWKLLALGTFIIVAGPYVSGVNMPNNFLVPLGLFENNFSSSDYYPLIPWFGLFLYGMALFKLKYREKKSLFNFDLSNNLIALSGRHALLIYLVHQPVILGILYLFFS
ncbi:MAG TPA: hypothetical protein DCP10_06665 [Bacteroidales bacterium]|nr:hypothetical protein [Bacteroidales bacterium]